MNYEKKQRKLNQSTIGDPTDRHKPTKGAFGKAHPLVKMKRVNLGQNWRLG